MDPAVVAGHRTAVVRLAPPPLPARKDMPAPEAAAEPEAAAAEVAPVEAASADAAAPVAGVPEWPPPLLHFRV